MTFLEAKKIVEEKGYHVIKDNQDETFRERVAREELEEAKRIAEEAGYTLIREDEDIEDDDEELDEGCCGGKKKKGKKKDKKSDFVPFWAKKKGKVDESIEEEDDLDLEGVQLDEGFGTSEGTNLSKLCEEYVADGHFLVVVKEKGLQGAKDEFLARAREVTGDKYYKTLSARIQAAKSAMAVLYVIQGAMFGGQNLDMAAGTRQSAFHRNR